ncbi:chromate transporter [Marinobacterium sp. MBR-109]
MQKARSYGSRIKEVFMVFLMLGFTSFGGPVAHLGYFRSEFVQRRRWLSEADYADLVALCQFLPGPASSQVGFALGLLRAGYAGALAAWTAFTLPSAIALVLFALGLTLLDDPISQGALHGLKITAVAVVAHAVWGMARNFCPDRTRTAIALGAVVIITLISGPTGQVCAILVGVLAGLLLCRSGTQIEQHRLHFPVSRQVGHLCATLFTGLLLGLPVLVILMPSSIVEMLDAFYRAGALVFGGGHVVLPLLEAEVVQPGWVTPDDFLAGYSAAQAVPGPLFTFAAYLGAIATPAPGALSGAALALVMIFLPGLLILLAVLPHWNALRRFETAQAMMCGANAAVVGILGSALYHPLWTSVIISMQDFVLALTGFLLLNVWKVPAWVVVVLLVIGGVAIA